VTLPPSDDRDQTEPPARAPIRIMTVAAPTSDGAAPRPHLASDEERADERRLANMRAHWTRKPIVTWTLLGVIAAMFVLEEALGGSENDLVLTRLGGQVPSMILDGQPWRLISSAFLHAGILHVGLNSYVLWIVGSSLERMLGSARFLVAYTFSLVLASLASLALSDASLTVGASGAVFGLFGVEAVVVFLRPDLLPTGMRQAHARNVLLNLAINVVNSFQPNIATIAHFGGGLAGALIGYFIVPQRFDAKPSTPGWASAAAALSVLLLVVGLALALFSAWRTPYFEVG
jgi:membrane associated rhomboid family serine protease